MLLEDQTSKSEWPWLKTIIVTPARGNPIGLLFDRSSKTTPLLDFFEKTLFTKVDKAYRSNGFRIMSGFRHNGSIVLSALFSHAETVKEDHKQAAYTQLSDRLSQPAPGSLDWHQKRHKTALEDYVEKAKSQ